MKFVQLGREVRPLIVEHRHHKGAIIGIKDDKFVVVLKQDGSRELVRLKDVVLGEAVYDLADLRNGCGVFFEKEAEPAVMNDFERFQHRLQERIKAEMLQERGL